MKPCNFLSRIKLMLRQLSCREARSSNYLETLIFSFWFFLQRRYLHLTCYNQFFSCHWVLFLSRGSINSPDTVLLACHRRPVA